MPNCQQLSIALKWLLEVDILVERLQQSCMLDVLYLVAVPLMRGESAFELWLIFIP